MKKVEKDNEWVICGGDCTEVVKEVDHDEDRDPSQESVQDKHARLVWVNETVLELEEWVSQLLQARVVIVQHPYRQTGDINSFIFMLLSHWILIQIVGGFWQIVSEQFP